MGEYLLSAKDRKNAILNDTPDTKFYFESQKFSDVPNYQNRSVENRYQRNDWGAQEVRKYSGLIDAAAARYSIDPDIVKAIIYTEVSGGWYGYAPESFDAATHKILPKGWLETAHTILPGNISPEWQELIPGSDVHNPRDNIELTTKLISQIANRLDDPSIENIYSLYNSLSHDRTYVNKEAKTTPYFAKKALEAEAWEKDDWSSPEFPKIKDVPRDVLPSDRHGFLDNSFGNGSSFSADDLGDTRSPVLRALQNYERSAALDGAVSTTAQGAPHAAPNLPIDESALGDRSENASGAPRPDINSRRVSSAFRNLTPRNPDEAALSPERVPLLGIFSGKPMSLLRLPPSVWGLPDNSDASGDGNWFNFLAGLALQDPTQHAPSLQAGAMPGRRIVDQPPASAVDTRAPAVPLTPSDDRNFSGGLLGRLRALAGIDAQNPNQPAPPLDDEQEQADMRALDARLSNSGNIRDAVALYKARKSKRQKAAYDQV
jgi:hypothetical protein